jgi:hypothetical protein
MMKIGYARVSTEDQKLTIQLETLKKAGCTRIFFERAFHIDLWLATGPSTGYGPICRLLRPRGSHSIDGECGGDKAPFENSNACSRPKREETVQLRSLTSCS